MVNSYKYVDIIVAILSPETPKPLRLQGFSNGNYGYSSNALNFTLDLSDWRVASVTNYTNMFNDAGLSTSSWTVTIPAKTGNRDNSSNAWYVGNGTDITKYIEPASGKQFTPADD